MATNRYGDFNTQPIYNVTGRLNRGPEAAPQQFRAPNSGANRQWGSNQGMPNTGVNAVMNSLTSYWSPINLYDMARYSDTNMYKDPYNRGTGGRRRSGGGSPATAPEQPVSTTGQQGSGLTVNVGAPITFAPQNEGANVKTFGGKGASGNTNVSADVASANQVYAPQQAAGMNPVGRGTSGRPIQPFGGASINIGNVTGGKINQPKPTPRRKAGK